MGKNSKRNNFWAGGPISMILVSLERSWRVALENVNLQSIRLSFKVVMTEKLKFGLHFHSAISQFSVDRFQSFFTFFGLIFNALSNKINFKSLSSAERKSHSYVYIYSKVRLSTPWAFSSLYGHYRGLWLMNSFFNEDLS